MGQNVEVFSIKVVMETVIMRVFPKPPLPRKRKHRDKDRALGNMNI